MHLGTISVDLKGNGDEQPLWKLFANASNDSNIDQRKGEDFYIKFDRGDVHWFRGYCHAVMGLCDLILAHDWEQTFNFAAPLLFNRVETPYSKLITRKSDLLDVIAMVHSTHWNVIEPQRMLAALHHFEMVPMQSKESWKWIMEETDDDHEWLPNPRQTGVFPRARVTDEMVASWLKMMDQGARILAGDELVPFFRGDGSQGINVRRMFTEPQPLDPIYIAQGSGLIPYLETNKPLSTIAQMRQVQGAFGRDLMPFAFWFN
jgi:hypothetical protein